MARGSRAARSSSRSSCSSAQACSAPWAQRPVLSPFWSRIPPVRPVFTLWMIQELIRATDALLITLALALTPHKPLVVAPGSSLPATTPVTAIIQSSTLFLAAKKLSATPDAKWISLGGAGETSAEAEELLAAGKALLADAPAVPEAQPSDVALTIISEGIPLSITHLVCATCLHLRGRGLRETPAEPDRIAHRMALPLPGHAAPHSAHDQRLYRLVPPPIGPLRPRPRAPRAVHLRIALAAATVRDARRGLAHARAALTLDRLAHDDLWAVGAHLAAAVQGHPRDRKSVV